MIRIAECPTVREMFLCNGPPRGPYDPAPCNGPPLGPYDSAPCLMVNPLVRAQVRTAVLDRVLIFCYHSGLITR